MYASRPESGPRRLADFEIVRELGRGGMGIVYEARQQSLNRRVALKVLSGGLGLTAKAVIRFKREAEAAARLHHTNIVPIYTTGDEDGIPYYAMELIDGPSLDRVIQEMRCGGVAPARSSRDSTVDAPAESQDVVPDWVATTIAFQAQATEIQDATSDSDRSATSSVGSGTTFHDNVARMISEVADALAHAHDQGVIHRDIKPSNLLLSRDGRLSVNDFGLARLLEQPGMTISGEFMGSPMYMSPEQIAAGRVPLDHRTDIYSLGATLYELLTCQPPFAGRQRDQVLSQIMHKEPLRPKAVNKRIPQDLETICLKAMEKDPDRRYQTADRMADDLRCFVNRDAISARRIGPIGRTVRWTSRHRALAATLACAVLLTFVAAISAYHAHRSERQRTADKRVFEQQLIAERRQFAVDNALVAAMGGDLGAAERAIEEAELMGASPGWIRILRGQVAFHRDESEAAINHLEQAVKLLPENVAAHSMLALACLTSGHPDRAGEILAELDGLSPVTSEDYLFKGQAEAMMDPARGMETLNKGIRLRDSPVARLIRAEVGGNRAMDTANRAHADQAIEDARIAVGMLGDNPYPLFVRVLVHLAAANAYEDASDAVRRQQILSQAGRDAQQLERFPDLPLAAIARMWYFEYTDQEEAFLKEAIRASAHGVPLAVLNQAVALYRRGEFRESADLLDRPGDGDGELVVDLSLAYILLELPDGRSRSLEIYRQLAERSPMDSQTILQLHGRNQEAVSACLQFRQDSLHLMPRWRGEWYHQLLDYCCNLISKEDLLTAAGSSRLNQSGAHYQIALTLLADGDRAGARAHLRNAVATRAFTTIDYMWSRAFLTRMEQDVNWPSWIPTKQTFDAGQSE